MDLYLQEGGLAPLEWIDIGGGLPIDYTSNAAPQFEEYVKLLKNNIPELFNGDFPAVYTEFGRALFTKCGWACSYVEYTKVTGKSTSNNEVSFICFKANAILRSCTAVQISLCAPPMFRRCGLIVWLCACHMAPSSPILRCLLFSVLPYYMLLYRD